MLCAGDDIPEEDDDSSSSLLSKNGTRHSKDKDYLFYNCRGEDIFSHLEQPDGGIKNGCLPGAVTGKEISPPGDVRCRRRTESCSSTSSDLDISPIGLDDITFFRGSGYASESDSEEFHYSPTERGRFFKVVPGAKSKTKKKVDKYLVNFRIY